MPINAYLVVIYVFFTPLYVKKATNSWNTPPTLNNYPAGRCGKTNHTPGKNPFRLAVSIPVLQYGARNGRIAARRGFHAKQPGLRAHGSLLERFGNKVLDKRVKLLENTYR